MGFNTVAVLYNDHWHEFAKDGPLGGRIANAMRNYPPRESVTECWFEAGEIVSQAHADYSQVVVVGRNTGQPLDKCDDLDWHAIDQLKAALERHGYRVTKRRKPLKETSVSRET